jgi:hypothetical protein
VPSASLLLAIAACLPEFSGVVPSAFDSFTALAASWGGEGVGDETVDSTDAGTDAAAETEAPAG